MTVAQYNSTFEEYLLNQGLVLPSDLENLSRFRKETGEGLCAALRKLSLVEPETLAGAIADYHAVPLVEEHHWRTMSFEFQGVSHSFLRENNVIPLKQDERGVLLAIEDPTDEATIKAVRLALDHPVRPAVAPAIDIQSAIERFARERAEPAMWQDEADHDELDDDVDHLRDIALGTPVVRYVNEMIQDAVHMRATDIHIEPFDGRLALRMRIDGMLRDVEAPPANMTKAIISRVKILSGLNIAERRLPQDGRARIRVDQHRLDLRVATMPTIYGEAVAIRLLDNVRRSLDLGKLGFCKRDEEVIRKNIEAPYGLILVTGPTGSGKTTTLATALSLLNRGHRKILTIEDPIEYELDGINQTQAKPEIGLSFANALRSFLRHDPDVLMVGEMRDGETASIGIHAALTGHLVLSTLHTNTAAGAIPRLLDMGIDSFLLASSLRCVIGQRLVRVLCNYCKQPDPEALPLMGTGPASNGKDADQNQVLWRAVGCDRCFGAGYNERMVISEVLDIDDEIRDMIRPSVRPQNIEMAACRRGMSTMLADGMAKCRQGLTTPEEVRHVALEV